MVAIIGKNGAGKSTLLKCVNHILKPAAGKVHVNGDDVAAMGCRERAKKIGYLSQKSEQVFPSTVFETVLAGRYPYSPYRFSRSDEYVASAILAEMKLGSFSNRQLYSLSGGEQQQVLIARALAQEADMLLFDEPTNNLDLRHQLEIMALIRRIAREKRITFLIAIHDLNLAAAFADRVIVMHKGGIYASGAPLAVFNEQILSEAFGVEAKIHIHDNIPYIIIRHSL